MLERSVVIKNALGLHARAAAQLVRLAGRFKCRIAISRADNGISANAKSILSVLHLAAAFGTLVRIEANGDDEAEAMQAIVRLFENGFGEI